MPRTRASAGARLNQAHVAFAFAVTPVTLGTLVVCALAGSRLISYWWLALPLGWAIVPLAILVRACRYARQVQPAGSCQAFPLAHQD